MNQEVLTDLDFEKMSWHDNLVYSLSFPDSTYSFKLDLDYILEWTQEEEKHGFIFLLAPAVLCFYNVSDLSIRISFEDYAELSISQISRANMRLAPNGKIYIWDYLIELDRGEISFTSTGYQQTLLDTPKTSDSQKYRL